ncbi:MAG: 2-phospho-L-lactate transferase CofD family protein, partial [Vicinamibacteria bacterium]
MIVVLGGGVGAAKFLRGLVHVAPEADVTVVVNTADDKDFFGLHVSPDIDTVLYTLAGLADRKQGWGIARDTFSCLEGLKRFGHPDWFRIGDQDLSMHI